MIGYKNTISGGNSIMQPIKIPENTRNVILVMNLVAPLLTYLKSSLLKESRAYDGEMDVY